MLPAAPVQTNPYLAGRRTSDDRYAEVAHSRRQWQYVSGATLLLAGLSLTGNLYQMRQVKVVPYVIQTDVTGQVVTVGPLARDDDPQPEDRIIRAHLAAFIRNSRTVTADRVLLKRSLQWTYAIARGKAVTYLNDFYHGNDPFHRAATESVAVTVLSVVTLSETSWQVRWKEEIRNPQGLKLRDEIYEARVTTTIKPDEVTVDTIWLNPQGIFVTDLDWTRSA